MIYPGGVKRNASSNALTHRDERRKEAKGDELNVVMRMVRHTGRVRA